jgi:mediator of RNA polymerase II transcription subunit 31
MLEMPAFVAYLAYLQYWATPEYAKYLSCVSAFFPTGVCFSLGSRRRVSYLVCRYPGPSLRALQLLQQESFRRDILRPDVMVRLLEEGIRASVEDR